MSGRCDKRALLLIATCLLLTGGTASARIIYVDADAPGQNEGYSWADAFNYLQDALANAKSGDEIRVAAGTYKPDQGDGIMSGDWTATFQLRNGVTVTGGYAGYGQPDPNARDSEVYETILSGDLFGDDADVNNPVDLWDEPTRAENSYHVGTGSRTDETAVLDGFTIIAGNASYFSLRPPDTRSVGGGIFLENGSPRIVNCTFTRNSAFSHGGAMYNKYSTPTVINCSFNSNSAVHGDSMFDPGGGGMYNNHSDPTITDCTFTNNRAPGGGMYNYYSCPIVTDCIFSDNSAAAMCNGAYSQPILARCIFAGNYAQAGGGMYNEYDSRPVLTECRFTGNSANEEGGGMWNWGAPVLASCVFAENVASLGGGMYNAWTGKSTLMSCEFNGNFATANGGGMCNQGGRLALANCGFTANTAKYYGGAMYNDEYSRSTMDACVFRANMARLGAVMFNRLSESTLTNCAFTGNRAEELVGAVHNRENSSLTLTNCIFTGNSVTMVVGGVGGIGSYDSDLMLSNCTFHRNFPLAVDTSNGSATIANCIFRGHWPEEIDLGWDSNSVVTYTDIQGGWPGEGNTDTDPCFASPGYWADANDSNTPMEPDDPNAIWIDGDYHLKSQVGRWDPNAQAWVTDGATSPCIDAGDPNSDWTGELWPHGKRVNMGAYGGTLQASMSHSDAWNVADIDIDGLVRYTDMMLLTDKWLCEEVLLREDLSRDGFVNLPDLAILADNWQHWELPEHAVDPRPPNGANDVGIAIDLSWTGGARATSHDVYFGVTNPPPFIHNQIDTTFDPGIMALITTYFWRIDEVNPSGTTTGKVWAFTTREDKGRFCFPADTLVWVGGRLTQISQVSPGQTLTSFAGISTHLSLPQVESVDEHKGIFDECYDIVLETRPERSRRAGNPITVIGSHFFLTDSGAWTCVQDLRPGHKLQSQTGPIMITHIVRRQTPYIGKVYNLKIKSSDRYCVGQDALIARDY